MFWNYIKTAWRNLKRNLVYSVINIVGLTLGLTACLLVATVVLDDLSYDRQWNNSDNIYRIISIDKSNKNATERFPQSFTGLGPSFKKLFPEVREYCRMQAGSVRLKMGKDQDGVELNTISAEPSIWKILNFDVIAGSPRYYQKGYTNLVITQKIKDQFFPDVDPIGKILNNIPEFGKPGSYIITGVIKDIPANTTLRADVLEIKENSPDFDQLAKQGYGTFAEQYLLLDPKSSVPQFEQKANRWLAGYFTNNVLKYSFSLQNIKDVYLYSSEFSGRARVSGDIHNVYIFSGVAFLLLLIACINFVNLTTARALKRIKEAGIRKILGAERGALIAQFLFESLLFFLISFIAGIVLYSIFLNPVEAFLGHPITLALQSNLLMLSVTFLVVLLVSLITGLYPALLLSAQNPILTLKGKMAIGIGNHVIRKGLIVSQFTISVLILIGTLVVQTQLHFMDIKDLGYDKRNLLHLKDISWDGKSTLFKSKLTNLAGVESASVSSWYPGCGSGGFMTMQVDNPHDKKDKLKVWYIAADFDFVKTMKFHLQRGRLLDPLFSTDALNNDSLMAKGMDRLDAAQQKQPMLITNFSAKIFNINELNKKIAGIQGIPVGIINDFNNESLKSTMKPVFIRADNNLAYGSMLVRIRPGSEKSLVPRIYQLSQKIFPDKVFQYEWSDEVLNDQYNAEHKLQQLFVLFSCLILILAALGLFGLTMYAVELRIKEIGIRKVLGASIPGIALTLSSDFIKLVLLGILIASPVAWYFAVGWLQNFSYRIEIYWWIFFVPGAIAVAIAIMTISFQTIKAAVANPVKSLRSE